MGKLSVFIFVLFLAALAVFAIHNKELTTVTIPFDGVYELPKIALILLSSAAGALAMLLIFAVRDTRKFIDNLQFQKKQKRDIKVQELYSKALNSILAHKEDLAREALGEILAEEPDHVDALLRLGDIYSSEEDYQKANTYYQKARTVNPRNLETLFALEKLLEKSGYKYEYGRDSLENNQLEKAKKAFKTVLRLDKDFTPATLGIAEVMLREGESEEAVNLLEKTYETTSSTIVLARLEDLLISLGEPSRIIRVYKSGISKRPNDLTIRFFLAKLFYRLEMIDDALETLSGMESAGLPYPELHQLMGSLYMRRNQPAKAVEEYKKVVEIRKSLRLAYCCKQCGFNAEEWSGRCPGCGSWDTYQFNLDGACSTVSTGLPA
ncbi:MAG: tetratricopeptide repeat protein [Candidatus Sulfobium sp.]